MTPNDFKKFVKYTIIAFQRVYFPKNPFFKKFFSWLLKYFNKKSDVLLEDITDEFLHPKYVSFEFLSSFGRFDILVCFVSSFFLIFLVKIWPFALSDFFFDLFYFFKANPLFFCVFSPLFCALVVAVIPKIFEDQIKNFSLFLPLLPLFSTFWLFGCFDYSSPELQFLFVFEYSEMWNYDVQAGWVNCILGIDGISLLLLLLSAFIFLICFHLNFNSVSFLVKESIILHFILEFFVFFTFSTLDLISFFLAFESTLIPLFLIILIWGPRERRLYAAYKLFFYTALSSLFMLLGIFILIFSTGFGDFSYLFSSYLEPSLQKTLWILFFLSLAVKLPLVPFHLWLPEAHVEAPTSCSVILAAVLLKIGAYGFFRFLVQVFPIGTAFFTPFLWLLGICAIIYSTILSLRQVDLKKIIAYSSIAHMGFIPISISTFSDLGFTAGIFILVSHGIISAALFSSVGVLYDRYKTKLVFYFKSLASTMPLFSSFFFLFILANIGVPLTSGFIGEFFLVQSLVEKSFFSSVFVILGSIFGAVSNLWLFNRVCFGQLSTKYIVFYQDANFIEFSVLFCLAIIVLVLGVFPFFLTDVSDFYVKITRISAEIRLSS